MKAVVLRPDRRVDRRRHRRRSGAGPPHALIASSRLRGRLRQNVSAPVLGPRNPVQHVVDVHASTSGPGPGVGHHGPRPRGPAPSPIRPDGPGLGRIPPNLEFPNGHTFALRRIQVHPAHRRRAANPSAAIGTILSTFSGPSTAPIQDAASQPLPDSSAERLATQKVGAQLASAAVPSNPLKAGEFGLDAGHAPQAGTPMAPHDPLDTASTVTEGRRLRQGRQRRAARGLQRRQRAARPRARRLRWPAPDDQHGDRRQRQPELAEGRSARPGAARGTSCCARRSRTSTTSGFPSGSCTRAVPPRTATSSATRRSRRSRAPRRFASDGKRTPVFVRFSTVAGERGAMDLARDVRGFAVKFLQRRRQLGQSSATTCRCSSSRTRSSSPTSSMP